MSVKVKICGITKIEDAHFLEEAEADLAGFVFHPTSSRHLSCEQASLIEKELHPSIKKVALAVDPDDHLIENMIEAIAPDYIQLHGAESPERCSMLKQRFNCGIIKALGIGSAAHLEAAKTFDSCADFILLDAMPRPDGPQGGTGHRFDWSLLTDYDGSIPWFLAGGLTPDNVQEAVQATGATYVDVSSGVERQAGEKDRDKISRFIQAARLEK
jgi:phosphoribosylanthranilate isomerase